MKFGHSHVGTSSSRLVLRRQGDLLRRYLNQTVLPFSKHYAAFADDLRRIRRVEDLRYLPFTIKRDVQDNPRDFILIPDPHLLARRPSTILRALWRGKQAVKDSFEDEFRPSFMTFTTGRSSQPLSFLYTGRDLRHLQTAGGLIMRICGAKREMKMLNMFPYAPHLAFWLSHYAGTEFGVLMVSSGGGKVAGTDGNLRIMQKLAPEVLIGMPTFIYHVLQAAVSRNLRCPQLSKFILGGEKAPTGMRRKLKALATQLGAGPVDVLMTYGFTEAKMAWPECPCPEGEESGGFHLYPDLGIIEIVDPKTGEPVGEGRPGEIVFTPLDARGTVVLRYRTGDLIDGGLVYEPCPHCGRQLPRLVGHISRTSEMREMRLDKLKGTLVDFNELEHVLDNFDSIGTWQMELRKANDDPLDLDELILHVEKLDQSDDARLRDQLNDRIASVIELHPNRIVFESPEKMRGLQGVGVQMKEQRLVDHRPKPGSDGDDESSSKRSPFMSAPRLVIVDGVRTPFCKWNTHFASLGADELGRIAVSALLARTGLDPQTIDEVIFGCVCQPVEAANISRVIALRAGIPESVPAITVHRNCASGFEAVTVAFERMAAGRGSVFVVGGAENMSQVPLLFKQGTAQKYGRLGGARSLGKKLAALGKFRLSDFQPRIALKLGLTDPVSGLNMGETAEILAQENGINREMQDKFAVQSHQHAVAAHEKFSEEICPVYVNGNAITEDNGPRADTSLAALAKLKPVFDRRYGTVTAGNSSQISDGAVALLVMTEERARKLGFKQPLGRLAEYAYTGCDPARMGLGPVSAIRKTGRPVADADLIEINEAFAAQVLAVLKVLGDVPREKLNVNGGSIALGHPVGATGARLVLSALKELQRRQGRRALVSACVGGGQGGALWLERL